jgi:cell division septation protein DedD
MEESNQDLSEKFPFTDFKKLVEKQRRELAKEKENPEKETLYPPPQALASLKSQRRSKRSLLFVALLCLGLGILVLALFFTMEPEGEKPDIVAKGMRRPIVSVERRGEPMAPGIAEKGEGEEKSPEGVKPQGEKLSVPKLPEAPLMNRERGTEEKTIIIGGTEIPKQGEGEKATETARTGLPIAGRIETKPQEVKPRFAKLEQPKTLAIPEQKLPISRYTVNVGSFRKRVWAERLIKELDEKGYRAFIEETVIPKKGTLYRVAVGRFPSRREAQAFARGLKERDDINSFVRKLKEVKQ